MPHFRDNLWAACQEGNGYRICRPGKPVEVFIWSGRYWGQWSITKTKTTWKALPKLLVEHMTTCYRDGTKGRPFKTRGGKQTELLIDKNARRVHGFFKRVLNDANTPMVRPIIFVDMANSMGYPEAAKVYESWHKDSQFKMHTHLMHAYRSLRDRERMLKHMAKRRPQSSLALMRLMHPTRSKGSLRLLHNQVHHSLWKLYLQQEHMPTKEELRIDMPTNAYLPFNTDAPVGIYWWLGIRRLKPNNPTWAYRALNLVFHVYELDHRCAGLDWIRPAHIHADLERLHTVRSIDNMEAAVREVTAVIWAEQRRRIRARLAQMRAERAENRDWDEYLRNKKLLESEARLELHKKDIMDLEEYLDCPDGVKLLRTQKEFAAEGEIMKHCIGGYANSTRALYFSIDRPEGRASLEVTPKKDSAVINQLRGAYNKPVSQELRTLITKWANDQLTL